MTDVVLLSERLGPVSEEERRIQSATEAVVVGAPLWSLADIAREATGAAVIILGAVEPFDAVALGRLAACRAIVRRGVGTDNVDLDEATRLGIIVANVPDASVEEVSDHALALLLAAERRVVVLDRLVRAGVWTSNPGALAAVRSAARPLGELTLGIIGLGRIGRALARKALALYHEVIATDPFADLSEASRLGVRIVEIDELISQSDHVSVHIPLAEATHHLLDRAKLRHLRRGAVVVNTSRGGIVDEGALLSALGQGQVAAAGLDVAEREPLGADDPLAAHPATILTGHSAMASVRANDELARRSVDAAIALLTGRRPDSIANPQVLASDALRIPELRVS